MAPGKGRTKNLSTNSKRIRASSGLAVRALIPSFRKLSRSVELHDYAIRMDVCSGKSKTKKSKFKEFAIHENTAQLEPIEEVPCERQDTISPIPEGQVSTPVTELGQLASINAEFSAMPERPRNIGVVDQAQQQPQLITTSSNTIAKPPETTASNSLTLLQRAPTPNGLMPTASRGKLSSSDSQVSTNRTPHGVKDNQTPTPTLKVTHDDRSVRPSMVTVSTTTTTTPTTPNVIVRSVPVSRRIEGFSMIPRPQNIVQQPVSHPVRVYDAGKQQWQPRSNETDVKMGLNSTTTAKVPDTGAKFRLSTPTKIGLDGSGQNLKKQSVGPIDRKAMIRDGQKTPVQRTLNSPQPVPVKFNTPQNPNIRSIGIRHAVSSDGLNTDGYSRDANRITIIHAEATDSTVNSELSDFEDDSNVPHHHPSLTGPLKIHPQPPIPPMKRGSLLVYPKPLNERILSSLAEDVGWKGPDRDLTFVPQRNSRYINPGYSCGPEYSSTGNLLTAASATEYYHPVQRAPVTVSNTRPYLQQRHTKHMNQYKSTPDIMNATRPYTSSRLPYRSTSQDPTFAGPPQSMRRNYNYTGSTGYVPNTIPETDDFEPETQTYNNESQAMHTPRSYRDGDYAPTTISGLSQSYDFHPVQSSVPGYPIIKDERHDQTLPRRSITHAMANLNTNHYGYGTDRNDLLLYDELNMPENHGENPYMPLPTTPKSFRALPYERQNSSHLLPNQISPTDVRSDSMNYRMDGRKDTMNDFDPIFFERRRSVNIPQDLDYMNARWRRQSQTMGPDFYHSGGIPSDFQLPGSIQNQMHSISGPETSPAAANTRMMMMMSMMKDPGYIHVRAPTVPEQSDIYGVNPYIRGPNTSYQEFAQSNLFGSRPRSLCDNLLIQPPNQEAVFNPAEYGPTPMRSEFEQTASAKPYYGNRERMTYSEWDVSRIGLSDDQPSLHPDSYIHTRPNIRRGFGGNYTRPNAGLSRVDLNGHATNPSGRSQSLERPHNRANSGGNARTGQTVPDSSVNGTQHATSSRTTSSTNSTVSSPSNAPTRIENPVRISSPTERTPAPVSTRPGSKIAMHSATPPLITWREKSTKEIQTDKKIRKLIGQLPTELQQTTSFVLLMMNSTGSDEDCDKGLEARLRQAFQMIVPIGRSSPISEVKDAVKQPINGFAVMDEAKSNDGTQLLVNGTSHIGSDESNEMASKVTDPRMTQSCFLPSKLESNRRSDPQNLPNPSGSTFACSLDSDASTGSDMDMTVSNSASDEFADFVPRNVSTVLRLLARCMAERLAWKRNQLVDAQQHVTRNTSERKWLRNKLNELFTDSEHNSSINLFSPSLTPLDGRETPVGNVVVRFDRWHNNALDTVELLCHLSRRLAFLDAQIECLNLHSQQAFVCNDINRQYETKQTMADLQQRQSQLKGQIKEAQELRTNQENCRLRLLESIPPGLKLTDSWSFYGSTPSAPTIGNSAENSVHEDTVTTPAKSSPSSPFPVLLRDQISIHLAKTMQWLITYHVLHTEIGVDQEICDNIHEQQRLEVTY